MANPRGGRRKVRKNIGTGVVHIRSTFNNTTVTITDVNQVNLYDLNEHLIKEATVGRKCSLAELMCDEQQPPDKFVSHWWGESIVDFLACLKQHSKDRFEDGQIDGRPVRYWVCAYCNNQHNLKEEVGVPLRQTSFYRAMTSSSCRGTVVVLDKEGITFTRIWCVYEYFLSTGSDMPDFKFDMVTCLDEPTTNEEGDVVEAVCLMDGICYEDERKEWLPAAENKQEREQDFPVQLVNLGVGFESQKAEASVEADKDRIVRDIEQSGISMEKLDTSVRGRVAAAGTGLVVDDPTKLAYFLEAVRAGGAPKLGIGPAVDETEQVEMFLDSAVDDKLTELYVGTEAIHAPLPSLLTRFGRLRVLK